MTLQFSSTAKTTTLYVAVPQGARFTGRVKEVEGTLADPEAVHPGEAHEWYETLHFGQRGTGFVECCCGAVGVPYS